MHTVITGCQAFLCILNGFHELAQTAQEQDIIVCVGCTIEDATGNQDNPLYDVRSAVERIAAAARLRDDVNTSCLSLPDRKFTRESK